MLACWAAVRLPRPRLARRSGEGRADLLVLERLEALEKRLAPLGFPLAILLAGGELTFAGGLLTDYWQVCLPSETEIVAWSPVSPPHSARTGRAAGAGT